MIFDLAIPLEELDAQAESLAFFDADRLPPAASSAAHTLTPNARAHTHQPGARLPDARPESSHEEAARGAENARAA